MKAEAEVLRILAQRSVEPEETAKALVPFIYDPATPLARLEEDMTLRRKWFPTSEGYFAQLQGIMAWEAYSRLTQILATGDSW